MTDSNPPKLLVSARIPGEKPRFTSVLEIEELLAAAQKTLPMDKVYIVQEGPGGFSFREAGVLVVSFQAIGEVAPHSEPPVAPIPIFPEAKPKEKKVKNKKVDQPKQLELPATSAPVAPPPGATKTQAGSMKVGTFTPPPTQAHADQFFSEELGFA